MMKGALMDIYGEILIAILMLVIFFLLLTSVFSAFGGTEPAVVRLNAELLRSKISDACNLGEAKINRLTFPQAAPYPTKAHWIADVPGFLAKTYTKITGDPKYILYYEAFPAGEAIGWEVYHTFDYRIIAPFDYSKIENRQTIDRISFERGLYSGDKNHVEKVLEGANRIGIHSSTQAAGAKPVTVIANNIILTSELNPIPNEEPKPFVPGKVPRSGEWKIKTQDRGGNTIIASGDNTFEFSSYDLLTSVEQTTFKYRSCGKNSLCLKTTNTIERLVLPESCNNKPLQYIQLEYDNTAYGTAAVTVGGTALVIGACAATAGLTCITVPLSYGARAAAFLSKGILKIPFIGATAKLVIGGTVLAGTTAISAYVAGKFFSWFIAYKSSDFYLASPCTINDIKIEHADCKQICKRWMRYPLYEVIVDERGERKYVTVMDGEKPRYHYQCIENIEGTENVNVEGPNGACLKVKITSSPDGFCWTADPTKRISGFSLGELQNALTVGVSKVAHAFGFTPVRDSALYIQNPPGIALKPTTEAEKSFIPLKGTFERRYWWGWPGSFDGGLKVEESQPQKFPTPEEQPLVQPTPETPIGIF